MFVNDKSKIINKYIKLLLQSINDAEIENLIKNLIDYHVSRGFDINSPMVKINGPLLAIRYMYSEDLKSSMITYKNVAPEEKEEFQNRIMALNLFLKEIDELIKKAEEISSRQINIKNLEKKLSNEEINAIKDQYLPSSETIIKR